MSVQSNVPIRWAIAQMRKDFPPYHNFLGAEVGVYEGDHALSIVTHLGINKLYLVDRWGQTTPDNPEQHYVGHDAAYWEAMSERVRKRFSDRPEIIILRMDSVKAASSIEKDLDFMYLDATHTYEAVVRDLAAWHQKVRVGGLLLGDDWRYPGVREAVEEFVGHHGYSLKSHENEWMFKKL